MAKLNLAVIFGGKSPEHEVSIITGFQAATWVDTSRYEPYLIYLDPSNRPHLCPTPQNNDYRSAVEKALAQGLLEFVDEGIVSRGLLGKRIKIDIAVLATHGGCGENGQLQGLLEYYRIPYTGSSVLGSSLGMDKVIMKQQFTQAGLKTVPYDWFYTSDWQFDPKGVTTRLEKKLGYPLYVKPARSGSSLGISNVKKRAELTEAIKKAALYDNKIVAEKEVNGAVDINCAILGGHQLTVSLCEQPIKEDEFLSFEEKYLKGGKTKGMAGLNRIIPAPIPDKTAEEIQTMATTIFKTLDCWGNVRLDFLYQKKTGRVYPGEINTIPGSLAYYLWKASGIEPPELLQRMIDLAFERQKESEQLSYTFTSTILDQK